MDDLSGLDWNASNPTPTSQKLPPMNPPSYYPNLRPTPPLSGRSTPSSIQNPSSGFKPPPNSNSNSSSRSIHSTPVNDSFAKLVAFNAPQPATNVGSLKNISLLEKQKALQERREKEKGVRKDHLNAGFGTQDGDFLESLGNGRVTPNRIAAPPSYAGTDEYGGPKLSNAINKPFVSIGKGAAQQSDTIHDNGENNLLSDFASSSANISDSLHALSSNVSGSQAIETNGSNHSKIAADFLSRNPSGTSEIYASDLDDDTFGLGSMALRNGTKKRQPTPTANDDDILGALGRPVSESPRKDREQISPETINPESMGPAEQAWAKLTDMGFSPDKSREALERTESGLDVEAAVAWLLHRAHQDSSKKSRSQRPKANNETGSENYRSRKDSLENNSVIDSGLEPNWLQEQNKINTTQRRHHSRSPVNGEKDPGKHATEFGTTLLRTANSLWKTGTKKLNQAVSELNSDSESGQPKWMREAHVGAESRRSRQPDRQSGGSSDDEGRRKSSQRSSKSNQPDVTDEALQLESGDGRPPRRPLKQQQVRPTTMSLDSSRDQSPASFKSREHESRHPWPMQPPRIQDRRSEMRKDAEEEALNAYRSPARRKKTAPKPPSPEPNLLVDAFELKASAPQASYVKPSIQSASRVSFQTSSSSQPLSATRVVPLISSSTLETCTKNRLEGTSAFKIGDYPRAAAMYSSALSALPPTHPLNIVLLTNRALAHLKMGDPKSSIADSESAISLIGPSHGARETINLSSTEGSKDMSDYWLKAMTRQAEALEQLERWSDAAAVWRSCVEAGLGGATSITGRNRCEKAAAGSSQTPYSSKPTIPKKIPPKSVPKVSAVELLSADSSRSSSLAHPRSQSTEAVVRLRKANAAAERLDDEKFTLADQVSERLAKWRAGKENNLRALLASLENVLWEGAGWKKVSMSELILAGKVKVVYMRGISKVHPDKLPPTATTEEKMISAAVFATLNMAWDGFKRENGL
ncbi:hypothetical protein MMC07_006516 [Pseudocyphellaria aurata]|nr:hypothetical protein [Pseudocyphellaria aurata]